jgi:hypothetical protein
MRINPKIHSCRVYNKTSDLKQAIINFQLLQQSSCGELKQYFRLDKVRSLYLDNYGDNFTQFESKVFASEDSVLLNYSDFFPFLDRIQERKLILQIQAAMSLPMQDFSNTITEQDALLKEISLDLVCQSRKAQLFIEAVQKDDLKFKKSVMRIGFSVVKLGLSFVHLEQLVDISEALADLASSGADKVDDNFDAIVSKIEGILVQNHIKSIQTAELQLLTKLSNDMSDGLLTVIEPKQIEIYWEKYRLYIYYNCINSMKEVLDKYVYCDDFFRCVVKQTAYQKKNLSPDALMVHATENARLHVKNIFSALDDQIKNIRHIRDAVSSPYGSKLIADYFRRVCLIQYTLSHENSGSFLRSWLTKRLGHRLSFYFPDLVFQKKWSPVALHSLIRHKIKYCKKEMTLSEYRAQRRSASVVLGLFRNSHQVKQELFASLEFIMPELNDQLIEELQSLSLITPVEEYDIPSENVASLRMARYSFSRRRLSLFSFREPSPDEVISKPIPNRDLPVVLLTKRDLYFDQQSLALEY